MYNRHDNDMQMEVYLSRVSRQLNSLPPDVREQELAEVRQHVSDMVEANIELDMQRDEAVVASLRQFGNPTDIGKQLAKSWRRGAERNMPGTVGTAIAWCVFAYMATYAVHFVFEELFPIPNEMVRNSVYMVARIYGIGLLISFVHGFVPGFKAPRFAYRGTTIVYLLKVAVGTVLYTANTLRVLPADAVSWLLIACLITFALSLGSTLLGVMAGRSMAIRRFLSQAQHS